MNAARKGDQAAIETLTFDDMDLYSKVSKRLANEDVFSIVDTYFMPFGAECDMYSIMGEILAVRERINRMTGVRLYQMRLNVNELTFDICVPADSVMGESGADSKEKSGCRDILIFKNEEKLLLSARSVKRNGKSTSGM